MLIRLRTSIILHRLMPISKANCEQKNNTKIRSTRTATSTTNKNNLQSTNNDYKHIPKCPDNLAIIVYCHCHHTVIAIYSWFLRLIDMFMV